MSKFKVNIDADLIVYQVGHSRSVEGQPLTLTQAKARTTTKINNIKLYVQDFFPEISDWKLFITSDDKSNYRFETATIQEYKGNRGPSNKPQFYNEIRDYLQERHDAVMVHDMEADDELSIRACENPEYTITVTSDKDLRGTLGWYVDMSLKYPPYFIEDPGFLILLRQKANVNGKTRGKNKLFGVGKKWFYAQCLLGDRVDNIPGIDGCGDVGTYTILNGLHTEEDFQKAVLTKYIEAGYTEDRLNEVKKLLWMKRKRG